VLQELATDLSLHRLAALCVQQLPYQARQAWATANNTTSTTATSSATTAVATDSTSGVVVVPQSALESDLSGFVGCAQHADVRIVLHGEHCCLPLVLLQLPEVHRLQLHCICDVSTAGAASMRAITAAACSLAVSLYRLSLPNSTVMQLYDAL
jgi:hypothetical protein